MQETPAYACHCLNVKIIPIQPSELSTLSNPPRTVVGWDWVAIKGSGIHISHEQLTLVSRSADDAQLLVCRLCNTLVYRLPKNESSQSNEKPEIEAIGSHERWIQVCVTTEGCLTGKALVASLKKESPIFNLIIPTLNTMSPSPTPPTMQAPLPLPPQLDTLPDLFPPPPFVPNHPLFSHLARVAKRKSSSIRASAEEDIARYIEQKRREVLDHESGLKADVNNVWRTWKDSQDRALPQGLVDPAVNKRLGPATVIRDFNAKTVEPQASRPSASYGHVSALSTSLRQPGFHMPRPPSPPPSSSPSPDMEYLSQQNQTPVPVRPSSTAMASKSKHAESTSNRHPKPSAFKRRSGDVTQSPTSDDSVPSKGETKRKAVTFRTEPDVVTVTREIVSERLQDLQEEQARGEEPMFDMDDGAGLDAETPTAPPNSTRQLLDTFSFQRPSVLGELGTNGLNPGLSRSLPANPMLGLDMDSLSLTKEPKKQASKKDPYAAEIMSLMAGNTPSHRSAWKNTPYQASQSREVEDFSEDSDIEDEEDLDHIAPLRPSTSAPVSVPPIQQVNVTQDQNFQEAMSKSLDPGPILELSALQSTKEEDEEDEEAQDLMQQLIEGRGSLHAQRILSHQDRGPPASMWRSLA